MMDAERKGAKERLRGQVRRKTAALTEAYRRVAGTAICRQVEALETWRRSRVVFGFMSLPGEPDTRQLLLDALALGKEVWLPRCEAGRRLAFLRVTDLGTLRPGTMGIREPEGEEEALPEADLILVPCMAAAPDGTRLGHGGGYYDRFLKGKTGLKVCLCFSECLAETLPVGENDVPVDCIVTEDAVLLTEERCCSNMKPERSEGGVPE